MSSHQRKPWIAVLLSILTLGLGHIYVGRLGRGLAFWGGALFLQLLLVLSIQQEWLPVQTILPVFGILAGLLYVGAAIDAGILARLEGADYRPRPYNRVLAYVGFMVGFALVSGTLTEFYRSRLVQAFRIPSGAMEPTLQVGDFLFVNKAAYDGRSMPARQDIVVFPHPENPKKMFIKRVVALPGETLEIRDKVVHIDGRPLVEPYAHFSDRRIQPRSFSQASIFPAGSGNKDNYGPVTIPEGHLFMMGDNRDNSDDSRFWGFLDTKAVKGKAKVIYWSWDSGLQVRWNRIGQRIG